jgi:tetratricopeptide (TPR) repeat protein
MYERALTAAHRALEIDESHWLAHYFLAEIYITQGKLTEALVATERAYQATRRNPFVLLVLAGLRARTGSSVQADSLAGALKPEGFAGVLYHLILGQIDSAVDCYQKAIEDRDPLAAAYAHDPTCRALRESPRWPALAKMMNLQGTTN